MVQGSSIPLTNSVWPVRVAGKENNLRVYDLRQTDALRPGGARARKRGAERAFKIRKKVYIAA
jgi:hypothetical protein